jgi:UDP-N-acetylbacillosamine N-acetyltransferase
MVMSVGTSIPYILEPHILMKSKVVIWGASGHAKVVADIFRLTGEYEIVGFIDDFDASRKGSSFCGEVVLGGREELDALARQGVESIVLAFGNCRARLTLSQYALKRGYKLAKAIHPNSIIASDVTIGDGTVVAAGAIVNPGSVVGQNVIINTNASVDHDCTLEDAVHISPGAQLAGSVWVGSASWVGIGATVIDRVRIGEGSLVGAGSVVIEDVPDGIVVVGAPAKFLRSNL